MRKRPGKAVTEPHKLTLWPDDALPGQLSLFNRGAEVGTLPGKTAQRCERCESAVLRHVPGPPRFQCATVIGVFPASLQALPMCNSPTAALF